MGLLDDAIREHLELKRLRGADPGEVAREQREALDPVPRDERTASQDDFEGVEGLGSEDIGGEAPRDGESSAPGEPAGAPEPAGDGGNSDDLRETAELDMRTVLDKDQRTPAAPASRAATGSMPDAPVATGDEESLEWEVPGDSANRLPAPPEQERLRFDQRPSGDSDVQG